jgi:hypothetical protein
MHLNQELAAKINSAQYIYLRSIREPRDNQLEILIEEATANRKVCQIGPSNMAPAMAAIVKDSNPIESTGESLIYRLYWKLYAAYLVTEEMVGSCGNDDDESYEGRLFRLYTRSHFLDHLSRDTGAHANPLLHFKITCLNHLIDVAAESFPEIEIILSPTGATIQ